MLTAVNGYIDGNKVIVEENITDWQGRNVVVTILDSVRNNHISDAGIDAGEEKRKAVAMELAGLWNDHDSVLSVDDTVREMRRGRHFNI